MDVFYDKKSTSSLSALLRWTAMDPITADGNTLAAYKQVELVILSYGLAFRALWVAQFPELYSDVPAHVLNSSYPFSEYEQLGHSIQDLITGYADTYFCFTICLFLFYTNYFDRLKEIESAYADRKRRPKPSAHHGSPKKSVGNKQTEEELTEGRGKKGPNPRRYVAATASCIYPITHIYLQPTWTEWCANTIAVSSRGGRTCWNAMGVSGS